MAKGREWMKELESYSHEELDELRRAFKVILDWPFFAREYKEMGLRDIQALVDLELVSREATAGPKLKDTPGKLTTIIRGAKGAAGSKIDLDNIQVPDLWHAAMFLQDNGALHASLAVLDCWHLAHDLITNIQAFNSGTEL